jgi:hypothetical protein
VVQFCHPVILWIWLFTVCAGEETEAAAKTNIATARIDTLLIESFTIIFLLLQGIVLFVSPYRARAAEPWRLPMPLLWLNPFSQAALENRKPGLLDD